MAEPSTIAAPPKSTASGEGKSPTPTQVAAPSKPAVAAAPETSAPSGGDFNSMLDDLVASPKPATPPPGAANGKPATPTPAEDKNAPEAEPLTKDGALQETPKPALPATPAQDDDESKGYAKVPELRREFNTRSKLLKEREAELQRAKAELESSRAPKDDPEKKAMAEKMASMEKELGTREMELRHANYLKSREYVDKFRKPFEDALAEAYSTVAEFEITNEDGTTRRGSEADFMRILNQPLQQAHTMAKALFGDVAPEIMAYRRKLKDIQKGAEDESKRYREQGEVRDKEAVAAQAAQRETLKRTWQEENEKLAKQYPDFFGMDENDNESNEWLKKGFEYVDRIFQSNGMPPEQRIKLEADVRNRAAAFGRLAFKLKKAQESLKEREEELAAYRESTPKGGARDGSGVPVAEEGDFYGEIDKLVKQGT